MRSSTCTCIAFCRIDIAAAYLRSKQGLDQGRTWHGGEFLQLARRSMPALQPRAGVCATSLGHAYALCSDIVHMLRSEHLATANAAAVCAQRRCVRASPTSSLR